MATQIVNCHPGQPKADPGPRAASGAEQGWVPALPPDQVRRPAGMTIQEMEPSA